MSTAAKRKKVIIWLRHTAFLTAAFLMGVNAVDLATRAWRYQTDRRNVHLDGPSRDSFPAITLWRRDADSRRLPPHRFDHDDTPSPTFGSGKLRRAG
jgi:hypothetical protein